jgi:hypothetical protein
MSPQPGNCFEKRCQGDTPGRYKSGERMRQCNELDFTVQWRNNRRSSDCAGCPQRRRTRAVPHQGPSTREISAATLRRILALRIDANTVELWCHESRCIHDEQPIVLQFCRPVTEFSHAPNNGFVPRFYEPGRMITLD